MPGKKDLKRIEKIEKKIGKKLKLLPIEDDWGPINGYSCDKEGNMTSLNLFGS